MRAIAGVAYLTLFSVPTFCSPSPFPIVVKGTPVAQIAVLEDVSALREAGQELAFWLEKMTNARLPVTVIPYHKLVADRNRLIVLGVSRHLPGSPVSKELKSLNPEGFLIAPTGDRLWMIGNSELAVRHSVFTLLEHLGCRFFFPDPVWTVVPRKRDLSVATRLKKQPAFAHRLIWYEWGAPNETLRSDYENWMKRNRQYGHFPFNTGHAYEQYIPHSWFDKRPDWFALVSGQRRPTQLCVTNQEVQRIVTEKALEIFRSRPETHMVSVEPNDGGGYCECPHCQQLGSITGQPFYLANVVAKAVREEFPDKWVGLLAYAYHSDPPSFPIEPGVYVQVTTGFRYTDLSFAEQVRSFQKLGAQVGVYDYLSVYPWDFDLPGAAPAGKVYQLADRIKDYYALGLTTYCAESSLNWGPNGLGYWMASRLMWEPDADPRRLVADFFQKAFKRAGRAVQRIYERWSRGERFSPRNLRLSLEDLNIAYRRTDDPQVLERLDRLACYLHYLRLWLDYDRISQQWLVSGDDRVKDQVLRAGRQCVHFIRRIMDFGLIHSYATLFTEWFPVRFELLVTIAKEKGIPIERWKDERTDPPLPEEIRAFFSEDLEHLRSLVPIALEIETSPDLYKATTFLRQGAKKFGRRMAIGVGDGLTVIQGTFLFYGRKGEVIDAAVTGADEGANALPFSWRGGPIGSVPLSWQQSQIGGSRQKEIFLRCISTGWYRLDIRSIRRTGLSVNLKGRPFALWCGVQKREDPSSPLALHVDRVSHTFSLFVPKGTRAIVISTTGSKGPITLELGGTGKKLSTQYLFPLSQITTIVNRDLNEYGEISEIGKQATVPSDDSSVVVPDDWAGKIWSVTVRGVAFGLEIYNVPPLLLVDSGR